jgi:hypothetical protein
MNRRSDPQRYGLNACARGVVGAALISQPSRIWDLVDATNASDLTRALTWVLGVRHLAEAVLLTAYPLPTVRRVVTGVDVVHAASMCALAIGSRRYRTAAAAAAVLAVGLLVVGRADGHDE